MTPHQPTMSTDGSTMTAWLRSLVQLHGSLAGSVGWKYRCVEDLVLDLGRWGVPAPLPRGRGRGTSTACYANATTYSATHALTYVEGYGLTPNGLVLAHAWCVDDYGHVHDPTWPDDAGKAYLGIPFTAHYVQAVTAKLGDARLLHDDHRDGHRILRHGLPATAIEPIGVIPVVTHG